MIEDITSFLGNLTFWGLILAIGSSLIWLVGLFVTFREFYEYFLQKKFRNLIFRLKGTEIKVFITKTIIYNRKYTSQDFKKILDFLSPKASNFEYRAFTPYQNYATFSFKGAPAMIKLEYLPENEKKSKVVIQTLNEIAMTYGSFGHLENISLKLDALFSILQKVNYDLFESYIITNLEVDVEESNDKAYEFELDKFGSKVNIKGNRFMIYSTGILNISSIIKAAITRWNSIR